MFDAIEATDWAAIPGFAELYEPSVIAPALRRLADATNPIHAAHAGAPLFSRGLVHDHSGGVHPAMVAAAPILLDLTENAHPAVRPVALGLLGDSMDFYPYEGYATVATSDSPDIPLCCAVASTVRSRRAALATLGNFGKAALASADRHWRFTVSEATDGPGPSSTLALGRLEGAPVLPADPCDIRYPGRHAVRLSAVVTNADPAADSSGQACVVVAGLEAEFLRPGTVLCSPCSDRVH